MRTAYTDLSRFMTALSLAIITLAGGASIAADQVPAAREGTAQLHAAEENGKGEETPSTERNADVAAGLLAAIQNNPDIRVAEARVKEAEAELRRTKLDVTRKFIALTESLKYQRKRVSELQKQYDVKSLQFPPLAEASIELATMEAELQYLLGQSTPAKGAEK